MPPSREKIIETVEEVMSQRQFHFEEAGTEAAMINLPDGFVYVVFVLLLCFSLFFLFKGLKDRFQSGKKGTLKQRAAAKKKKKIPPPPSNRPIEQLHAACLSSLQKKKLITLRKWKTNFDYINESKNPLFQDICSLYDFAVYGKKEVPPESVSLLREQWATWENQG